MHAYFLDVFDDNLPILISVIIGFVIIFLIIWVRTLLQIGRSTFKSDNTRLLWMLFVLIFPLIGMICYWFIGRQQRVMP